MKRRDIFLYLITSFLAIFFVLTNSDSTSPLFCVRAIDSQIFQYMGFYITQGGIPYSGLFDHKGLLIYWINAVGYLMHPQYGVLFLQIVHLTLVLIVWYKILEIVKREWLKFALIILSLLCLYVYYFRGNLTEEWSLLLISYPIMLYYDTIEKDNGLFSKKKMFAIGLCVGALSLLRLNNAFPVIGLLLYCFIDAIRKKQYRYTFCAILYISLGFILPVIISCCYMFYLNGMKGIYDMYYATILFNIDYSIDRGFSGFNIEGQFKFLYKALLPAILLIPLIKRWNRYVLPILSAFILTYATLGSTQSWHYLIIFIPLITSSFACLSLSKYRYVAFILIGVLYAKTLYRQFDISHFDIPRQNSYFEAFQRIIAPIPDKERNQIWNLNATFLVDDFRNARIVQQNRMLFPFQLSLSRKLYEEECCRFQIVKPRYVIFAKYKEKWMNYLTKYNKHNDYKESKSEYDFLMTNYKMISSSKWEDGTWIFCYKLKG